MTFLNTEQIIKILSMPKIGRKTALKLIQSIKYKVADDKDLMDFINENGKNFRLPFYSTDDFSLAFSNADQVVQNSEKENIKIIDFQHLNFPKLLKESNDCPVVLNYKGDINKLNEYPTIAIIGTRTPTDFGLKFGTRLAEVYAQEGINIVSGLAIGCDTAGHVGALRVNGLTTAVLAHGLDKVYPKENKNLAAEILDKGGLLLSEYFVKQGALSNFFVERDRIQAGLSLATVVVETDIKGGTMHTVKFTLDNRRILTALNHPLEYLKESKTQGNQMLIREKKALPIFTRDEVDGLKQQVINRFEQIFGSKSSNSTTFDKNFTIVKSVQIAPENNTQSELKPEPKQDSSSKQIKPKSSNAKSKKNDDKNPTTQQKLWG